MRVVTVGTVGRTRITGRLVVERVGRDGWMGGRERLEVVGGREGLVGMATTLRTTLTRVRTNDTTSSQASREGLEGAGVDGIGGVVGMRTILTRVRTNGMTSSQASWTFWTGSCGGGLGS
jgi:hypothetical protein